MIRPLSNHLLVERVKREQVGAIVMPQSVLDDDNTGGPKEVRILAVGPGRLTKRGVRVPMEFSPGDRAIIHSYTVGPTHLPDGKMMITEDMILAIVPLSPPS